MRAPEPGEADQEPSPRGGQTVDPTGPWVHETTSDLGIAHRVPVREVTAGEIEAATLTGPETHMTNDEARLKAKPRVREARLKAEFAHLYPLLDPGCWEPAAA